METPFIYFPERRKSFANKKIFWAFYYQQLIWVLSPKIPLIVLFLQDSEAPQQSFYKVNVYAVCNPSEDHPEMTVESKELHEKFVFRYV